MIFKTKSSIFPLCEAAANSRFVFMKSFTKQSSHGFSSKQTLLGLRVECFVWKKCVWMMMLITDVCCLEQSVHFFEP